jgi:microcin C transport system permease protein
MLKYLSYRLILLPPTIFIILLINFFIIQMAPGGPIDKLIAQLNNHQQAKSEIAIINNVKQLQDQTHGNLDSEILEKIQKQYGFDLPIWHRFWLMLKNFCTLDFGESFYQDKKISQLISEKLPVSISIGLWTTFFTYLIAIPLGIKKAMVAGSAFDKKSTLIIVICHALPAFLIAIFFIIFFCGGSFFNFFPLRGLASDNFANLNWWQRIIDYIWHLVLPISSMVIGGFASLVFFCKNSFLEEIQKNYVLCALAKGLSFKQVLYRHVFRNAMLIIIANLPALLLGIFFGSSMLIEIIFSLDGLGLLGYEATVARDYPLMFALIFIFTSIGLIANILSDICYKIADPRIDFGIK